MDENDTIPQDVWDAWPNCAIPACTNKSCLRLQSIYCWPHTPGLSQREVDESLEAEGGEVTAQVDPLAWSKAAGVEEF